MPPFQPDPFSARHVHQCSKYRLVTNADILPQTLVRQYVRRLQHPIVGPFRVIKKLFNIRCIHGWPRRRDYHEKVSDFLLIA